MYKNRKKAIGEVEKIMQKIDLNNNGIIDYTGKEFNYFINF